MPAQRGIPRNRSRSTTTGTQRPVSRGSTDKASDSSDRNMAQQLQAVSRSYSRTASIQQPIQTFGDQSPTPDAAAFLALANQQQQPPLLQAHQNGYLIAPPQYDPGPPSAPYSTTGHGLPFPGAPAQSNVDLQGKDKKGGSASAANDRELREILAKNLQRTLSDVATEVIATERTSKSEKTKQLFAMLWLNGSCRAAKSSVPRSRVYSTYATRCAKDRVQPLNPASFGKLVRVIFPGITTRRLGVRGLSKYHYVDLALVDDPGDDDVPRNSFVAAESHEQSAPKPEQLDFNSIPRLAADTSALPADDQSYGSPELRPQNLSYAESRVFVNYHTPGFSTPGLQTSPSYEQNLAFTMDDVLQPVSGNEVIDLPDIYEYAPPNTDIDAADALVALYRTHCTSLVDCIRFCKEKQFFRLFTTFQGTLTVPVQKLLVHRDIAPWIRECDWIMYQKMIQCVSHLTLQVVPPVVLKFLDTISRGLHSHIGKAFQGLPRHVLEAKLEPASIFAQLLYRMMRVNQTAHAAANVLEAVEFRNQMWTDWVTLVNPKRIMESELPNCGYEETYKILTRDIRILLQPLSTDISLEHGTHYEEAAAESVAWTGSETVVDRIAGFLVNVPSRFPHASARQIVNCISTLGSAAIRDITIGTGSSYNCWWLTKVFVDEMSMWLACLGGFLDHQPPKRGQSSPPLSTTGGPLTNGMNVGSGAEGSQHASRYSSVDASMSGLHHGASARASPEHPQVMQTDQPVDAAATAAIEPPPFEVMAMSFSTSSFDASQSQPQRLIPAPSRLDKHDEMDDSGIGLGISGESPFSGRDVALPQQRLQRLPDQPMVG